MLPATLIFNQSFVSRGVASGLRTEIIWKAKSSHLPSQTDQIADCVSIAKPEERAAELSVILLPEKWGAYNSDLIQQLATDNDEMIPTLTGLDKQSRPP